MPKTSKTIFLIEDDTMTIEVYKTTLESAGFSVQVFTMGQDVLKNIAKIEAGENKIPALFLLDIILPDIDGAQVLEKIRQNKKTKKVPVLVFTNCSNPELEKKCTDFNAEYIIKTNCPPSNLVKLIKEKIR